MLKIMTVCTGNICRSPMAALLLQARLADAPVEVVSAGTHALVGRPMTPETIDRARAHGADPQLSTAHRGTLLQEDDLAEVDIVLAMTREHRAHVVDLAPSKLRSAFTILEFARLADAADPLELVSIADGVRGSKRRFALMRDHLATLRGELGQRERPADDDVPDPYRRGDAAYDRAVELLAPAVAAVAGVVRLAAIRA